MASSQSLVSTSFQPSLEENLLISLPSELLCKILNLLDRKSIQQLMLTITNNEALTLKLETLYWQPLFKKCFPMVELAEGENYASALMYRYTSILDELARRESDFRSLCQAPNGPFYRHTISYNDLITSGQITDGLMDDKEFMSILISYDCDAFMYASDRLKKDLDFVKLAVSNSFHNTGSDIISYIATLFKGDVVVEKALENASMISHDMRSAFPSMEAAQKSREWASTSFRTAVAQPSARVETPQSLSGAAGKQEVEVVEWREIQEPSSGISSLGMFGSTAARGDDQGGPCPKDDEIRSPSSSS